MSRSHACDTKDNFLLLNNSLPYRLSRIKEMEDFFIAESNFRKKISKKLSKYITIFNCQMQAVVFLFSHLLLSFTTSLDVY